MAKLRDQIKSAMGIPAPVVHKGYLITPRGMGSDEHHISKDGQHIATGNNLEHAKKIIDELTG